MSQQSAAADVEPIERASIDELRALQLTRLQWSLQHAYDNVAHYKQSFDAAGVHPSDLRRFEDLPRFPLLTKQDFRTQYPFGLFAVPREHIVRAEPWTESLRAEIERRLGLVALDIYGLSEVMGPGVAQE
jgi:phenylacetate-coenzyme A ligase PaaK-like adenylate-forming protein